jgi:hypothetical protein
MPPTGWREKCGTLIGGHRAASRTGGSVLAPASLGEISACSMTEEEARPDETAGACCSRLDRRGVISPSGAPDIAPWFVGEDALGVRWPSPRRRALSVEEAAAEPGAELLVSYPLRPIVMWFS